MGGLIRPDSEILVRGGYELHAALVREAARAERLHVEQHTPWYYTTSRANGHQSVCWWNTVPENLGVVHQRVAGDKWLTRETIARKTAHGAAWFPQGRAYEATLAGYNALNEDLRSERFGAHTVLKPLNGSGGADVHVVRGDTIIEWARWTKYPGWILEQQVTGQHLRVLVLDHTVVAVAERLPATVIGDGYTPLFDLVQAVNIQRAQNPYFAGKPVTLDATTTKPRRVLREHEPLVLNPLANVAQGANTRNIPVSSVNFVLLDFAMEVSALFGTLPAVGLDFIVTNHEAWCNPGTNAWLLEVNAVPDIAMHAYPGSGDSINVAPALLASAFARKYH